MKKTDKKLDNAIRAALTEVCESALKDYEGFRWLTHFVDFNRFPESLSIVCVFNTNDQLSKFRSDNHEDSIRALIKAKLSSIDIEIKDIRSHVSFDTEENCELENNGNWQRRFR